MPNGLQQNRKASAIGFQKALIHRDNSLLRYASASRLRLLARHLMPVFSSSVTRDSIPHYILCIVSPWPCQSAFLSSFVNCPAWYAGLSFVSCAISVSAFASPLIPSEIHHSPDRAMSGRQPRQKMTIFRDKTDKNLHISKKYRTFAPAKVFRACPT